MRDVYLDEGVAHRLRAHRLLTARPYRIRTAVYMGWDGLPNREWMFQAHDAGFHVVVTTDQNIPAQQNLSRYGFGTVILSSPDFALSDENVHAIAEAIGSVSPHEWVFVEVD